MRGDQPMDTQQRGSLGGQENQEDSSGQSGESGVPFDPGARRPGRPRQVSHPDSATMRLTRALRHGHLHKALSMHREPDEEMTNPGTQASMELSDLCRCQRPSVSTRYTSLPQGPV